MVASPGCEGDAPQSAALLPACDTPTALTAAVIDRRQTSFRLTWTSPGSVATYQVRYARVPITSTNFDDATVTKSVVYTDAPAALGVADGVTVGNLYPESSYYFGVEAKNTAGSATWLGTTTTPAIAHFNVTLLTGSGATNEEFGYQFSAHGDINGDGHSDLVVGTFNGQGAYVYFGTVGSAPTTPSIVFAGDATTKSFGRSVEIVGDIDADGIDDLAISDRATPPRLFIYKGRATWPATMTVSDASYVISPDASYNLSTLFGESMARLGDFNGDHIADFAVGVPQFGSGLPGRVVIILGKAGFGNITLPDTTNTIVIDGDPSIPTGLFGYRVLGLGHFYGSTGTTLVVGAPGTTAGTTGSEGHLYAFRGQTGASGVIPLASADSTVAGNTTRVRLGTVLTSLGPIFSSLPALASGAPTDRSVPSGSARIFSGDATAGPFASKATIVQTIAGGTTNIGQAVIGSAISGVDRSFSLVGSATPDFVQIPQSGSTIYIVDGTALTAAPSAAVDVATTAAVALSLPTGWGSTGEGEGHLIPDFNGDGHPAFAIAHASGVVAGKIAVYW